MYVVTVLFEIGEGHLEMFRNAVLQQASKSLEREANCRRFDVCVDPANPWRFFLYEVYTDKSTFDAHLQTEHFSAFDDHVRQWLVSKRMMIWELFKKGKRDNDRRRCFRRTTRPGKDKGREGTPQGNTGFCNGS